MFHMWEPAIGMGWWMAFGGIWMVVFWGGLIALIVWGIKKLVELLMVRTSSTISHLASH